MRETEKAHMGQKIVTETAPDKSSSPVNMKEALMGRSMKGGPTDVSSSLGSAGEAQTYNDKTKRGNIPR